MENNVYERDYEAEFREQAAVSDLTYKNAVFEVTKESGVFSAFKEKVQAYPKIIVPEDRENYEYLLPRLDALARRMGGKIRAEINYQRWDSSIDLILPFFEFTGDEEFSLLRDIVERTDGLTVAATGDGQIRVHVSIDYFEEIGIDSAGKRAIFDEEMEKRPDLLAVVEEYRRHELKSALEMKTGIPAALMDEDMVWFIGYCNKLTTEEVDALMKGYFAGCAGNQHLLLKKVRQFRAEVEGEEI